MEWKDVNIETPTTKGYYATWCPDVPPQSHALQIGKWDTDYYGKLGWITGFGKPTHWAVIVPPNDPKLTCAPHNEHGEENAD